MTRAYVGLGANLGDREAVLRRAVERLAVEPGVEVVAVSSFRETDPVGPIRDQPRFLNGAVALETTLPARALLELLLRVECEFGRRREGPPGGPMRKPVEAPSGTRRANQSLGSFLEIFLLWCVASSGPSAAPFRTICR